MSATSSNTADRRAHPHWSTVLKDLKHGRTASLAEHLKASPGNIDPCVSAYLVKLIQGDVSKTGQRIRIGRHPDLGRGESGKETGFLRHSRNLRIMRFVLFQYHARGLDYKNSIFKASQRYRLSEAAIAKICGSFSKHQKAPWIERYKSMTECNKNSQ